MLLLPVLILLGVKVSCKCHISPLSTEYNITSDTIVSGTVKSFYIKKSGRVFAGKVRVRRVFRGNKGLEVRLVMVEGFGSKHICKSSPRLGDTKLLFLKKIQHRQNIHSKFKLSDNIIRLSLRNLKILWKLDPKKIGNK